MPVRPELFVRDARGIPVPPADLTRRLHERIGPDWDLRYLSASWAVTRRWGPEDARQASIRSGESDPAFAWDIIGYLPLQCSVDEAPAYLEYMLRTDAREEVRKLCDAVAHWNLIEQPKQAVEDVIAATRDEMGREDEVTSAIFAVTPSAPSTKPRAKPR